VVASTERSQVFRFGVFEVDPCAHELRRQGVRIRLQEQPFQVLVVLLGRAGEVVTRDELRQKLWPSSVFVDFDHGLNNAIARLRDALGDAAATPRFIETLPRLGYRFISPVEIAAASDARKLVSAVPGLGSSVSLKAGTETAEADESDALTRSFSPGAAHAIKPILLGGVGIVSAVLLLALLSAPWLARKQADQQAAPIAVAPKELSVAVLPFVNLSPEQENDYFADGLTDELISKLADIRGLKVAGQTSSFFFKNKRETPAVIGRTLNVRHILEGSVRRSGQQLRVTAQLIDAESGYHLWVETYDREATDVLQIQEDIARSVASALQVQLLAADEQRLRKRLTRDPEAYRLYLIARAQISWVFGRPDFAAVRRSYEEAITRDPEFAAAYAGLAHYYFNFAADDEEVRLGEEAAERAVALDPELSEALGARANWKYLRYVSAGDYKAYQAALQDFRRALALDPADALVLFHYARATLWHDPDLALNLFEETVRLDPVRYSAVGLSATLMSRRLGQHELARQRVHELYDLHPDKTFHNALNVAGLEAYLGRLAEAAVFLRESLEQGHRGSPTQLWALYMSLGDREAARRALDLGDTRLDRVLADAARMTMDGRYDEAFVALDRRRPDFPLSHSLDVPAARLALVTGRTDQALAILEQRLPDLAVGVEPIDDRNVLPALDLVAARLWTDEQNSGRALLERVVAFLDGPSRPHWPMYRFLRARAHALAGELESAQRALDRAYEEGFRMTWALDVGTRAGFQYIDSIEVDPAFTKLRGSPRYKSWLELIKADNARQLARLRVHEAADSARIVGSESGG